MNLNCSNQDACPVILDSKCVIYEGENLLYIGVNTNDNYRVALQNINTAIGNLILGGGITELVGDVVALGPGVASATLATVNSTPGQYGSSTAIPKVTVDGKGRVTAISTDPVFIPSGALNFIGDVTGSGNTGSNTTLTLATVNSNVYTTNNFLKFAVNGKGLITSATPVSSSDIISTLGYTPAPSGNYITQLTGEASASGPGVVNITLSDAAVVAKVLTGLNITGGTVLDTDSLLIAIGKIQNQLNALYGGSQYQGVWNASTNTPFLQSGVGTKGYYYIVNVPGTTNLDGITDWNLGDWAIFDGTAWQQVDNTDAVVSVNGFTGAVSLTTDNISEGLTNQYFTTSRSRLALSGGTGISYDNVTGVISSTITQYTDALARQAISLTTTGTSGLATYDNITGILNIPNYGSVLTGYVPYTGATSDVNLGTYGLLSDYLQLNTLPTSVPTTAGTMSWNDQYGTMDIKLKRGNVTLQVGQENVVPVVNKTGINLLESNYQAVRVRTAAEGGAQGQRLAVLLAQAISDANSATTIGIVTENIDNNQEGFITVFGNVSQINTTGSLQGETWVDGDILYLSPTTPGAITNIKPVAPQHLITLGYVVYAHSQQGIIFVKVDNGYELEELHNVYAPDASKVNNDVLTWNTSTSLWVNKSITDILGYTPANDSLVVKLAGTQVISGSKGFTAFTSFTGPTTRLSSGLYFDKGGSPSALTPATVNLYSETGSNNLVVADNDSNGKLQFQATGNYSYAFPAASGTLALTSALSGYVPTSRVLTINGVSYNLTADASWTVGTLSGSGTTNYIPRFTASGTIGNSFMYQDSFGIIVDTGSNGSNFTIISTDTAALNIRGGNNYGYFQSDYYGFLLHTQNGVTGNDLFYYDWAAKSLELGANGATRIKITSTGNVGIGVTSPAVKLDVSGSIRAGGAFTLGSGYAINFYDAGTTAYTWIEGSSYNQAYSFLAFTTGGSEKVRLTSTGVLQPGANGTQDLGTSSLRWATVYTSDLDMSNGVGDYTIVEGREDLFLYNNITKKVFKFALVEVDPSEATPKLKK